MDTLVSTQWLAHNLGEPDIAIVDSSAFLPTDGAIPARNIWRRISRRALRTSPVADRPIRHRMLLSAKDFGASMTKLGVGRDDRIVVYDNSPLRTAARGWFMFRHFGAERVAILDGGLQKWRAEGRPLESGEASPRPARFDPHARDGEVVTKQEILAGPGTPILDGRGKARFEGTEADPRPNVGVGHIPGSKNLPFASLYREDGTLKPDEELRAAFETLRVDPAELFIASCGFPRHRQLNHLRRASKAGGRHAAWRWKLSEWVLIRLPLGKGARLEAEQQVDGRDAVAEPRFRRSSAWACGSWPLAAWRVFQGQRRRLRDPCGTRIICPPLGGRRARKGSGELGFGHAVRRLIAGKLLHACQCLADRRKAQDRFGIGAWQFRSRFGRVGNEMYHDRLFATAR
jgi:thiosulfate/3-mercaptopyruvate sulfurtransferase